MEFNTALLHTIKPEKTQYGATQTPIYQVSAFAYDSAEELEKVFNNRAPGFSYSRVGNPTIDSFEKKIASLEGGIGAVACSSGMAAISALLLSILQSGDEVIAGAGLFGGTIDLLKDLANFGITVRFVDTVTEEAVRDNISANTKAVFTELIGNPKLNIVDLDRVSAVCHENGLPLLVDSTTATPYLIRPFQHGADVVIHSSSKYINGGGNSISGVIVDGGSFTWDKTRYPAFGEYAKFGKFALLGRLRNDIWRNVGGCLSPFNAFMNIVGLDTLGLRMERSCDNAKQLAEFLDTCDGISVNYPALPSSPYFDITQRDLGGKGGAILTIRAGSRERAFKLINALSYVYIATNIGDVRTLVIHPASTIYMHNTEAQQISAGVYDDTIRISVGIEDIADLISDFRQAIDKL